MVVQNFYQNVAFLGYKNHRLLAVDGGFLNLPDHESIREEFGRRAFGRGTKKQVESNTEIHRPGRKSPRKKRPPRLYHMNYKDV